MNTIPFNQQLVYLNKSRPNEALTRVLARVVKAVRETSKAGSLTLTLKVAMFSKANEDVVKITPVIASKVPEGERAKTIMYSTALLCNAPGTVRTELKQVDAGQQEQRTLPEQETGLRKVI